MQQGSLKYIETICSGFGNFYFKYKKKYDFILHENKDTDIHEKNVLKNFFFPTGIKILAMQKSTHISLLPSWIRKKG